MTRRYPGDDDRAAAALVKVLQRIELASRTARQRRCCEVCGCLCFGAESCPNCAVRAAQAGRALRSAS